MGCGCYTEKKDRKKNTTDSTFKSDSRDKNDNENGQLDKISSISSFGFDNSNINIKKPEKIKKITDKKSVNKFRKYNSSQILFSKKQVICNISWINFNNNNEKVKFQVKISKSENITELIKLIQEETNKLYHIKEHVIVYYKGIKVHEDEIIGNILKKQNQIIDLNLTEGNIDNQNRSNEINIIDFEVILIPFENEEDINIEEMTANLPNIKNENNKVSNMKEYNISKKIVNCLYPKCNIHKKEQLIYICLTCYNSFCPRDFEEHKMQFQEHEVINKNKLVDLNFEIRNIKQILSNKYNELVLDMNIQKNEKKSLPEKNQINYISTNELFAKIKIEIDDINETMERIFISIRESYQKINLKFSSIYEEKMPQIVEFSEYIDKTLSSMENLNTFSNENMFIENYDNCLNVKKISDKYLNYILSLKDIIFNYKEFLESFKDKGNNLIEYIKQGIDNIVKIKNIDKIYNSMELYQSNINDYNLVKNNKKNVNDISINTNKDLNQSINLKFLFSDKKAKKPDRLRRENGNNIFNSGIASSFRQNKIFAKGKSKNFEESDKFININMKQMKYNHEPILNNNEQNMVSLNISSNSKNNYSSNLSTLRESKTKINIYSLIYGTNKLIKYISKLKKLEVISPDTNDLKITKFETYIAKLNFKNKFYISGGYTTSKFFFEYDNITNKFNKLPEMISDHYYHNMIGYKNLIYSISGFKSKKVEKFNLLDNKWYSLPDLEYERTFPNSLIYNDNLFIFGKINNSHENKDVDLNIIEYINLSDDISNKNKMWNKIELKSVFPFNSGILKFDNTIILIGGKIDINENCINSIYNMQINNINNEFEINIDLNENKIEHPDEFAGNNFYTLDEKKESFGLFSINNPYLFYIFDKNTNKFMNLLYTEQKDDIS